MASSSSGNCIYVGTAGTHILVDSGISGKRLKAGLATIGLDPRDINAVLITHEHADHIKGLGVISRKYGIPVYTTRPTWKSILSSGLTGFIDENLFHEIVPDRDFTVNELVIHPFKTSHDAVQPVCYTFTKDKKKISVATDLGCYDSYIVEKLKGSNIIFIEANHDIEMLKKGSYPAYLKKRILSDRGHLSNGTSGRLVSEVMHDDLRYVILGHLSKENNLPEIAYGAVFEVMERSSAELLVSEKEDVSVIVTI